MTRSPDSRRQMRVPGEGTRLALRGKGSKVPDPKRVGMGVRCLDLPDADRQLDASTAFLEES